MKSLATSLAFMAMTVSVYGQANQLGGNQQPSKSKRAAEDIVAGKVDEIRASAKRPPLKRVNPSEREEELVCTAALAGKKIGDAVLGGLETYMTNDLSAESEVLKKSVLGFPEKDWPRYSVIVEGNAISTPENSTFTVGVARRPSATKEFFAPLFFDVPFKGMNKWKKDIAPECRNRKD